jgi:hypothetical protein
LFFVSLSQMQFPIFRFSRALFLQTLRQPILS